MQIIIEIKPGTIKRMLFAAVTLAALGTAVVAYAVPVTFKDGDVLTAKQLNDNFAAVDALMPAGTVVTFGGANIPSGWLACDGSQLDGTMPKYAALYAAIGTVYGGDAMASKFNLPDLRGRVAMGDGAGSGLTARSLGQTFGEESHTLTVDEMPKHTHDLYLNSPGMGPSQGFWNLNWNTVGVFPGEASPPPTMGAGYQNFMEIQSAGGGAAHNSVPPTLVLKHIIKL
jgi:microcystin-dependent protein